MTCIVAIKTDDNIYMGWDSSAIRGDTNLRTSLSKVFKVAGGRKGSDCLVGYTDSFRMGQIIEHHHPFGGPAHCKDQEAALEYMIRGFIPSLREVLKERGYARVVNNEEFGGEVMVGFQEYLFCIDKDFQVGIPFENFFAIGAGDISALACLATLKSEGKLLKDPSLSIRTALEIAGKYNSNVSEPYFMKALKDY